MPIRTAVRLALILAICSPALVFGQPLPVAAPDTLGLSAKRLARLTDTLKRYVDEGRIAGTVTLVARDGRVVYFDAIGRADIERNAPMQKDAIFRIASQSKAVTSVAIMMLVEEGRILLNDPVHKFIPAFKSTTVVVPPAANAAPWSPVARVAAKRPITIRDLLTHTAGIGYGGNAARVQYDAAGFDEWYFANKTEPIGTWIEKLASMPFDAQPGEAYVYGYSTDILGYVVEQVSGVPLDVFFRTRIFEPLKMVDTDFFLPEAKRDRLATVYAASSSGAITRAPDAGRNQGAYVDGPRVCFSGGAGLVSTASDYARFLQMLLNGGQLDGARILGPKTVELMTSNHTGALFASGTLGFGLGFEVTEHIGRSGRPGSVGEFGWGGAYFTDYFVDPQEKLVVVFMSQLLPSGDLDLQDKVRTLVYQAIEVPGRDFAALVPGRRTATSRQWRIGSRSPLVQREIRDTPNEGSLGLGVTLPVETILARQSALQIAVLGGDLRIGAQMVAEGDRTDPLWVPEGDQVKVMRADRKRRLAEPVLRLGSIGRVAIAQTGQRNQRRSRRVQRLDPGHDVDDRLCRQSRNGGASDMLERADEPRGDCTQKCLLLLVEQSWPGNVVRNDFYGCFTGAHARHVFPRQAYSGLGSSQWRTLAPACFRTRVLA